MYNMLRNVRVIDLTTVVLGPYATQLLGDLGAEVIKVEPPEGDIFRYVGPSRNKGMGAGYLNINKNKKSISFNLKENENLKQLYEMIKTADVFIHNMRPKAAEKLKIDYSSIRDINPSVIYCAATGFGVEGVYADKPAYDDIIQAESGIAWLAGVANGRPQYVPTVMADKIASLFTVQSVLTAIIHKLQTGKGSNVHVPMLECLTSFLLAEHMAGKVFDYEEGDAGYTRMLSKNRAPFKTLDFFITVMPYSKKHWLDLFSVLSVDDFDLVKMVSDDGLRSKNIDQLYGFISDKFKNKTTDDWVYILGSHDVPCGRVNTLNDLFSNPHLLSVGFFESYIHPSEGQVFSTKHPVSFSNVEKLPDAPPPRLGEHNGLYK